MIVLASWLAVGTLGEGLSCLLLQDGGNMLNHCPTNLQVNNANVVVGHTCMYPCLEGGDWTA